MANLVRATVKKIIQKINDEKKKSTDQFYDSIIEKLIGGNVLISVPEFNGSFYIDIRSHILRRIILEQQYEPELAIIVKKYLNCQKDVIDVGANIGLFTVLFSKLISEKNRVLSIEPTPGAFKNLKKNIEENKVQSSVISYNGIATTEKGSFSISIIPGKEEYSTVGDKPSHPIVNNIKFVRKEVEGNSIDNLVKEHKIEPGFIKIDVEGFEHSVIKGALKSLEQYKPVILMELSDILLRTCGHSSEEVIHILENLNYKVIDTEKMVRPTFPFVGDILAIPQ